MSPAWFISPVTATSGYGKHKEYAVVEPLSVLERVRLFSYAVDGIYLTIGCPLGTAFGSKPLGHCSVEAVVPLRYPRRQRVRVPLYCKHSTWQQLRARMGTHSARLDSASERQARRPVNVKRQIKGALTSEQLEISSLRKISLLE